MELHQRKSGLTAVVIAARCFSADEMEISGNVFAGRLDPAFSLTAAETRFAP